MITLGRYAPLSLKRNVKRAWRWAGRNPYCERCKTYGHYTPVGFFSCRAAYDPNYRAAILVGPEHKRRRVRKKRHQGEYQELGFSFSIKLKDLPKGKWDERADTVWEEFMDFLHRYGLCWGGGFEWGFITGCTVRKARAPYLHEGHRRLLEDWFRNNPEVVAYKVGPLIDAWYCSEEQLDAIEKLPYVEKH